MHSVSPEGGTPAEPPPPDHRGLVGTLAGLLLRYMDRPWKAATVVVLAVLLGVGWIAWKHHEELVEAWLTPSEANLRIDEVPAALQKLAADTDADLVQIWAVDLATNSQRFVGARRRDGERPVIPSPRRLPIIVTISDVKALISVLDGQPVCLNLTVAGSPLARRLAERGMKRGCAIPIPPSRESFVGVIYLAWASPTDPSNEGVAVGVARDIARELATR